MTQQIGRNNPIRTRRSGRGPMSGAIGHLFGTYAYTSNPSAISLRPTSASMLEATPPGTELLVFTLSNAGNPGSITLSGSGADAGYVRIASDGRTLLAGDVAAVFSAYPVISFVVSVIDDTGLHSWPFTMVIAQRLLIGLGDFSSDFSIDFSRSASSPPAGLRSFAPDFSTDFA